MSVNAESGYVTLWDSKWRSAAASIGESGTFKGVSVTQGSTIEKAINGAIRDIQRSNLPDDMKLTAIRNLNNGTFTAATNASDSATGGAYEFDNEVAMQAAMTWSVKTPNNGVGALFKTMVEARTIIFRVRQ